MAPRFLIEAAACASFLNFSATVSGDDNIAFRVATLPVPSTALLWIGSGTLLLQRRTLRA